MTPDRTEHVATRRVVAVFRTREGFEREQMLDECMMRLSIIRVPVERPMCVDFLAHEELPVLSLGPKRDMEFRFWGKDSQGRRVFLEI